jgi:hypothetical protein
MPKLVTPLLRGVGLGRKSNQPLMINVNRQGIVTGNQNVNPHIILEVLDQVRFHKVLAHHPRAVLRQARFGIDYSNALPTSII